jgi:hypothetical protein
MPYADREKQLQYQRDYMASRRAAEPKPERKPHPLARPLPEISELDLAWLAGLLEGEGWFGRVKRAGTRYGRFYYRIPIVQVAMNDEDVVRRIGELTNANVLGPHMQSGGRSPTFMVSIHGGKAVQLMRLLRPNMGRRRGERIDELLTNGTLRFLKETQLPG